jgi:RNA recognition motif-containing protein
MVFCLPISARVVTDRVSGYSKGFGFVQYATLEDAAKGIEGMDGKVRFIKPLFMPANFPGSLFLLEHCCLVFVLHLYI